MIAPYWYAEGGALSPEAHGRKAAAALEQRILELGPETVAAFIGEPIQGAGGVIIPPPGYWAEVQRICREHDVLLIADEVITGFGRIGRWWGSERYGITPDLMTVAKGLSSGYLPIAGAAARRAGRRRGRRGRPGMGARLHLFRPSGGGGGRAREPAADRSRRACTSARAGRSATISPARWRASAIIRWSARCAAAG